MNLNFFENGDIFQYINGQNDDTYLGCIDNDGDWRPCHGEEDDCPGDEISAEQMLSILLKNLNEVGNWERIPEVYQRFFLSDELGNGCDLAIWCSDNAEAETWHCSECQETSIVNYRLPFATGVMLHNGNNGDGWQIIPWKAVPNQDELCQACQGDG